MDKKIEINSQTVVEPTIESAPMSAPIVQDMSRLVRANSSKSLSSAHYQPANWHLVPGEGEQIIGRNIANGATFEGTMEEFNIFLRGE